MERKTINRISFSFLLFIILSVFVYSLDNSISTLNIIDAPPTITGYSLVPIAVVRGHNININLGATDDYAVDEKYASIRLPNGSVHRVSIPTNYTTTISGRHNITLFANDTFGNTANTTDFFTVGNPIRFNVSIIDSSLSGVSSYVTFSYRSQNISTNRSATGNFSRILEPGLVLDMIIKSYSNRSIIRLRGVNLTENSNGAFGISKLTTPSGSQIVTYGVNNTLDITNATVKIDYTGLSFTNESNLHFYKCDNWNFKNNTCSGSFVQKTAVHDKTANTFTYFTLNFSGFGIEETITTSPGEETPSRSGHGSSGKETQYEIPNIFDNIFDDIYSNPPFESIINKFPSSVLKTPSFTGKGFSGNLTERIILVIVLLIASLFLGKMYRSKTLSVSSKNWELYIKNASLMKKEVSRIFVVSRLETSPLTSEVRFGDKIIKFKNVNDDVRSFFKNALSSGPVVGKIKGMTVFALKNESKNFMTLFRNDEVVLKCEGISKDNSSIYYMTKHHQPDYAMQYSFWNVLAPKDEQDDVKYFEHMLEGAKKVNMSCVEDLRDYIKMIIKILQ